MKFVNFFLIHFFLFFFFFFFFFFLRSPGRDTGVQSTIIFFFNIYLLIIFFNYYYFFFFHVPSGASNFYFLTSRKLYHMKFAIFDVARCRMSATSLTFWLIFLVKFRSYMYTCTGKPRYNEVVGTADFTSL